MVWINNQHQNYGTPKGGMFGGAICVCPECNKKRSQIPKEKDAIEIMQEAQIPDDPK